VTFRLTISEARNPAAQAVVSAARAFRDDTASRKRTTSTALRIDKTDARSLWIGQMRDRRHPNIVAVALANKNPRIVWSVLSGGTEYHPSASHKKS